LQTLEDALTFFGQSFLFTMKLLFCRISFGQMRRQIIDLVVGKRIVSIISDLWILEMDATKELIMHWYYVAMMKRIKNNNYRMRLPGVTNATNRDPYFLGKMNAKLETAHLHCSHLREAMSSLNWTGLQMCWISSSCSDRIELDYKLTWKNVPPDGTVSRGSRFLSLLMREAGYLCPPFLAMKVLKKAYLNLTSTYTIHLARDTGMRRHSYRIGVICNVPILHCNHIGTLDAIASPAAPTKTLTVDQLEAFNAAKSALPTPLCYTTPPDSQLHALMVGASDHVIRTVIHGNRWHFRSRPTLRICLPSPLRMSTFRSVHGLSHPGIRTTKRLMMEMGPGTLP
ncbi:hypothetical protein T12_2451, partial [Trichinella patagoniensis]